MNRRSLLLALTSLAGSAYAQSARQVVWEDLVPKNVPFENPFAQLAPENLAALIEVATVRDRRARGAEVTPMDSVSERDALARLKAAKIDSDDLLARRKEIVIKLSAHARATNPALDKQLIRMPGYLLPLEFVGQKVTEFLLVPFVGACIHSPPPPPNQIVYVKSDRPIDIKTAFEAVWITGHISARPATKALNLVDGSADIEIGYEMPAARVETYQQ